MAADRGASSRGADIASNATSESGYDGGVDDAAVSVTSDNKHSGRQHQSNQLDDVHENQAHRVDMNGNASEARMNAVLMSTSRASLGTVTEGLILFDLTTKKGSRVAFSPNSMKTVLDLKLLNIGYERERLTFHQIRTELAAKVAHNVTVPVLELSNGSHLIDSWNIAEYLYERHPNGQVLFPNGTSSKSYARMMEKYAIYTLAANLRPLTRVQLAKHLDEESREYFENVKIGRAKMDKFSSLSSMEKQKHVEECIAALEPIEAALTVARVESPLTKAVWLEAKSHPTHVDFVIYSWYVYSRVADRAVVKEIWQAHSAIAKWISDMNTWAGIEITGDYF